MMPQWFMEMTLSDWNMVVFGLLQLVFLIDYCRSPFWLHPIGYIVIAYSVSVLLLVFLIIYGMIVGQRVDEWVRVIVTFALIFSIIGKIVILHYERARGLQLLAEEMELRELVATLNVDIAALEEELARERALHSPPDHPID